MNPKILFILNNDTKTGAPFLILRFLCYLKHTLGWSFDVLILERHNGLYEEFAQIADNIYYNQSSARRGILCRILGWVQRKLKRTRDRDYWVKNIIQNGGYTIIYGNTIATLGILNKTKGWFSSIRTVIHVHESEYFCSLYTQNAEELQKISMIDKIIAVSSFCANNLINNCNVDRSKVHIIYPFVNDKVLHHQRSKQDLRNMMGISDDTLLLTNLCYPHLTKGTDLLPRIAKILKDRLPNQKILIWSIGKGSDSELTKAIDLDSKKLKVGDILELKRHVSNPLDYLNCSDVYLIPSREDSFTLVGIEAAMMNIPIVLFKNAGGLTEVVKGDFIYEADYLDLDDYVNGILEMIEISKNRSEQKIRTFKELDSSNNCEAIVRIIKNTIL